MSFRFFDKKPCAAFHLLPAAAGSSNATKEMKKWTG
jgi:hypothetical protein